MRLILKANEIDKNNAICDFGCGPGFYSIELAKTGAQITGIDFSKRCIWQHDHENITTGVCAKKGSKIELLKSNILYKPDYSSRGRK